MAFWKHYVTPVRVEAALEALTQSPGKADIIAGGTDLLLDIQQGRHPEVETLIDVTRIPEMLDIRSENGFVYLGAAVTHTQILESAVLQEHARCLIEACGMIGGPQVRNVATIGGNVAHGLPAADGTIALLALDAEVQVASPEARRWMPLDPLLAGPGLVTLDRDREILVGFRFRVPADDEATAFRRVMRPQGVAIAIMNMAAWVHWDAGGRIHDVRLVVGGAGPRPLRAHRTEEVLQGKMLDESSLSLARETLSAEARPRTSPHRATAEYRHHLLAVLLGRVLLAARDSKSVGSASVGSSPSSNHARGS